MLRIILQAKTTMLTLFSDKWSTTARNRARQSRRLPGMATRHQGPRPKPSLSEPDIQAQVQVQPFISYRYVLIFEYLSSFSCLPSLCFVPLCYLQAPMLSRLANILLRTPRSNLPPLPRPPNTHAPTYLLERHHLSRPARPTGLVTGAERREHMHEFAKHVDGEHEE